LPQRKQGRETLAEIRTALQQSTNFYRYRTIIKNEFILLKIIAKHYFMKLPSRYEDLDEAYKGRLIPNKNLIQLIKKANNSISISGGIKFLPVFGQSGSGKSSGTIELSTHLPNTYTFLLTPLEIESKNDLLKRIMEEHRTHPAKILIPIIDQFEENVAGKESIPSQFIEFISLFDRNELKSIPTIFIWLTTSKDFQSALSNATTRNSRILISKDFEITGPEKTQWTEIIKDTFTIHNSGKSLADYEIIDDDIEKVIFNTQTIGESIQLVGDKLAHHLSELQDFSEYQIILLWPVADSVRNQRVMQYTLPRDGYKLNWDAFYRELTAEEKKQLPLAVYNRTRLYFDFRLVPVRVADLHRLCVNLENDGIPLAKTYLTRFGQTHLFHIINNTWKDYDYAPVRERESKRGDEGKEWYKSVTTSPVLLGKRVARILTELGLKAGHEKEQKSEFSTVKADVFVERITSEKKKIIIEMKVYSSENTFPSSIKDQIKVTLKRHAIFAGFMKKN